MLFAAIISLTFRAWGVPSPSPELLNNQACLIANCLKYMQLYDEMSMITVIRMHEGFDVLQNVAQSDALSEDCCEILDSMRVPITASDRKELSYV